MPGSFLGALAQGRQQSLDKKAQQQAQQQSQTFAAALGMANLQHLNAETKKLGEPSATDYTITDPGDGSPLLRVNKSTGETQPLVRKDGTPVMGTNPVKRAIDVADATKGIPTYGDLHPQPSYSATPGMDPVTGKPTVYTLNTKTGQLASTGIGKPGTGAGAVGALAAPMAAKVGQFGEMLKKASDLMPATDALNVSLGSSAAQDVATHGVGAFGMHVPGTQGVGSMMVNKSPEYATYQAALSPFILAAAHALSGARINDTQVQQIRASIEIKPGDLPQVRAQKHKNVIDLINSIGGSLPSDAIAAQEDQMDPNSIALLKGFGYRNAPRNAPKTGGNAPALPATGDINLGGSQAASKEQQLWDAAVKLHGKVKVEAEYGPRPTQ